MFERHPLKRPYREALKVLAEHEVEFLLVEVADNLCHQRRSHPVVTLFTGPTPANVERIISAYKELGLWINDETLTVPATHPTGGNCWEFPDAEVRLFNHFFGVGFDEAWRRRVPTELEGLRLYRVSDQDQAAHVAAKAAAEQETRTRREALIQRIIDAFPDPGWPLGKRAYDMHPPGLDGRYIIEHFHGKRWSEVTPEELATASSDAYAFGREGIAYFLPAYLVNLLRGHRLQIEMLAMADIDAVREELLNPEQLALLDEVQMECNGGVFL